MKTLTRTVGAVVVGMLFTMVLGAFLILHIANADERDGERRR